MSLRFGQYDFEVRGGPRNGFTILGVLRGPLNVAVGAWGRDVSDVMVYSNCCAEHLQLHEPSVKSWTEFYRGWECSVCSAVQPWTGAGKITANPFGQSSVRLGLYEGWFEHLNLNPLELTLAVWDLEQAVQSFIEIDSHHRVG